MPFSQPSQVSAIVCWTENLAPQSVLDIGAGLGQYGFMLRQRLEALNLFKIEGDQAWQRPKNEWRIVIDGIEGYARYLTPVHEWAYNKIMVGEALELLSAIATGSYELAIAIDVLEHFDEESGLRLLKEMQRVSSRAALISTPKEFMPQDVPANPYENHRSLWTYETLKNSGFEEVIPNPESWVSAWRA
jgi:SAM-dependent methyltransferase